MVTKGISARNFGNATRNFRIGATEFLRDAHSARDDRGRSYPVGLAGRLLAVETARERIAAVMASVR
jgi:hypothetical protein